MLQDEGEFFDDLDMLANLGTEGRWPNNMSSELRSRFIPHNFDPPLRTRIPVQNTSGTASFYTMQSFLLPPSKKRTTTKTAATKTTTTKTTKDNDKTKTTTTTTAKSNNCHQ